MARWMAESGLCKSQAGQENLPFSTRIESEAITPNSNKEALLPEEFDPLRELPVGKGKGGARDGAGVAGADGKPAAGLDASPPPNTPPSHALSDCSRLVAKSLTRPAKLATRSG